MLFFIVIIIFLLCVVPGKVRLEDLSGNEVSFDGSGVLEFEEGRRAVKAELKLKGSYNESRLTVGWDAEYQTPNSPTTQTIRSKSTISQESKHHDETEKQIDTTLSLDFSEFPDYNLEASWKYQVSCFFFSLSSSKYVYCYFLPLFSLSASRFNYLTYYIISIVLR